MRIAVTYEDGQVFQHFGHTEKFKIYDVEDGKVTNFPTWEQNLTFALQLQQTAETKYPGLMRPILFSARKYNMDITPCSVLLEMGSDSNTLEEAVYAGRLIGTALAELLLRYAP